MMQTKYLVLVFIYYLIEIIIYDELYCIILLLHMDSYKNYILKNTNTNLNDIALSMFLLSVRVIIFIIDDLRSSLSSSSVGSLSWIGGDGLRYRAQTQQQPRSTAVQRTTYRRDDLGKLTWVVKLNELSY